MIRSSGCTVAIAEYWQSLEPEEQLERYKPGSREYKELKAQLDGDDELQPAPEEDDNEQETSSPRQKRADAKKGKAKGREKSKSQSSSPKKKRGSEPAEADGQRSSKRARKLEEPEENAQEGEDDIDDGDEDEQDGFEDADKHECDWEDITQSTDRDSWEVSIRSTWSCGLVAASHAINPLRAGSGDQDRDLYRGHGQVRRPPPDACRVEEAERGRATLRLLRRFENLSTNVPAKSHRFLRGKPPNAPRLVGTLP